MIKIENVEVAGFEPAIRGMRNPFNSWSKSDTKYFYDDNGFNADIGDNDLSLMRRLAAAGPDHRKFMRMITVYADIIAPRYWWAEYSTYKVGTVANSCSTMHKIADKKFTLDDFSHEDLYTVKDLHGGAPDHSEQVSLDVLKTVIMSLNYAREAYLELGDKKSWRQMIQLLPQSYNQRRTVMLNYEVLRNMYHARKAHKLDEWVDFCAWIETLPYAELITGTEGEKA